MLASLQSLAAVQRSLSHYPLSLRHCQACCYIPSAHKLLLVLSCSAAWYPERCAYAPCPAGPACMPEQLLNKSFSASTQNLGTSWTSCHTLSCACTDMFSAPATDTCAHRPQLARRCGVAGSTSMMAGFTFSLLALRTQAQCLALF